MCTSAGGVAATNFSRGGEGEVAATNLSIGGGGRLLQQTSRLELLANFFDLQVLSLPYLVLAVRFVHAHPRRFPRGGGGVGEGSGGVNHAHPQYASIFDISRRHLTPKKAFYGPIFF